MPLNKGEEIQYTALKKNFTEFSRLCHEEDCLLQNAIRRSEKTHPVPTLCVICSGTGCEECNDEGVMNV